MSTPDRVVRSGESETLDPDDWDHHWNAYGEAAEGNPANVYRRELVLRLLGRPPAGAMVVDIGSGQGEFAIHLREAYPDVSVWGVEYSAAGVERSRAAAGARGAEVSFTQLDLMQPVTLDIYGFDAGAPRRFDITPSVPDACAAGQVEVEPLGRVQQHAGLRLPARAGVRVVVHADTDLVQRHLVAQPFVDPVDLGGVQRPPGNIGLIGHND
jgi:SAM-dependent methyltransferase